MPEAGFPGLQPGDRWCLCASRWQEALDAGVAPPVYLDATHIQALEWCSLDALRRHAVDEPGRASSLRPRPLMGADLTHLRHGTGSRTT